MLVLPMQMLTLASIGSTEKKGKNEQDELCSFQVSGVIVLALLVTGQSSGLT